ncbi:hypothetical protein BJ170DRAFT_133996 [Xylariales sp. AK1849]|nr:hypothetical protein BJ170DRAFT_133996 [Xylariales sp. AK1849]
MPTLQDHIVIVRSISEAMAEAMDDASEREREPSRWEEYPHSTPIRMNSPSGPHSLVSESDVETPQSPSSRLATANLHLVEFIHADCPFELSCNTWQTVDLGASDWNDEYALQCQIEWITDRFAHEQHPLLVTFDSDKDRVYDHEDSGAYMESAVVHWGMDKAGPDLMKMGDAQGLEQLELVRRRGHMDWVTVRFSTGYGVREKEEQGEREEERKKRAVEQQRRTGRLRGPLRTVRGYDAAVSDGAQISKVSTRVGTMDIDSDVGEREERDLDLEYDEFEE